MSASSQVFVKEYQPYTGPLVRVGLSVGDAHVAIPAVIDSGAGRSSFPLWVADRLGIRKLLSKDRQKASGVGSRIKTYSTNVPIKVYVLDEDEEQKPIRWGQQFELTPHFWKHEVAVLGRIDFFHIFTVTFECGHIRQFRLEPRDAYLS